METMREVHGRPFLLQRAGEFPAPREHDLPLSDDARRYDESGKRWPPLPGVVGGPRPAENTRHV